MPAIKFDTTLMRLIKDMQEVRAALRHVTTNLPLYDVANENTPASISTDQNDYVPGNYDVLRINATANVSITGISAGKKGRFLEIINVGTGRIAFPDESASSLAANRIATPYDQTVTLLPNARARFYYDDTQSRWTVADLPNIQGEFGKYAVLASGTPATPWQTVTASTYTRLNPPSVTTDEWGYWDSANRKFTVPAGERGFYTAILSFQMAGTAFGSSFYAALYPSLNPTGADPSGTFQNYARYDWYSTLGSYSFYVNITWSFNLVAGDAITFFVYHTNASGNLRIDSQVSTAPVLTFQKTG